MRDEEASDEWLSGRGGSADEREGELTEEELEREGERVCGLEGEEEEDLLRVLCESLEFDVEEEAPEDA